MVDRAQNRSYNIMRSLCIIDFNEKFLTMKFSMQDDNNLYLYVITNTTNPNV